MVDTSDPGAPRRLNEARATRGWVTDVDATVGRAFLADQFGGLVTLDLSDLSHTKPEGIVGGPAEHVAASERLAITTPRTWSQDGHQATDVELFDVSQPIAPQPKGSLPNTDSYVSPLLDEQDRAYVLGTYCCPASLTVLDASDHLHPDTEAVIEIPANVSAFAVIDTHLLVVTDDGSLAVADTSDPHQPNFVFGEQLDLVPGVLAVDGTLAFVGNAEGVAALDISDPAAPRRVGSTPSPFVPTRLTAAGGYVYVAEAGGLRIVDAREPERLVEVASVATPLVAWDVAVTGSYAVVAYGDGVLVVDVSDPAAPRVVHRLRLPG
jgi:hypothetical protein